MAVRFAVHGWPGVLETLPGDARRRWRTFDDGQVRRERLAFAQRHSLVTSLDGHQGLSRPSLNVCHT